MKTSGNICFSKKIDCGNHKAGFQTCTPSVPRDLKGGRSIATIHKPALTKSLKHVNQARCDRIKISAETIPILCPKQNPRKLQSMSTTSRQGTNMYGHDLKILPPSIFDFNSCSKRSFSAFPVKPSTSRRSKKGTVKKTTTTEEQVASQQEMQQSEG